MKALHKDISRSEIPTDIQFEGYYWYSHEQKPHLLEGGVIDPAWFGKLPFVIEGNFYAPKEKISIQVKNIDGEYHFSRIDLSQIDASNTREVEFLGHDLKEQNFKVVEGWDLIEDPLCENMETLVPTWTAFAGFTSTKAS